MTVNETNFTKTQWHPCVYPEILAILFYAIIISNMSVCEWVSEWVSGASG